MNDLETARKRRTVRNRYRKLATYSIWGGILALFAATAVWIAYPDPFVIYAGVGLYWLGFFAYLGIHYGTDYDLEDERDDEIANKAGAMTLGAAAVIGVLLTPAAVAIDVTGVADVPEVVWGIVWAFVGLFVLFGIAHAYYERQHQ